MDENNQIQFTNLTLDSAFQKFYTVPDYQREYVWKEEQVEQLLADITEAFRANRSKDYFVGSVVVYPNGKAFELVDGQQRMTTFFILLCVLKSFISAMVLIPIFLNNAFMEVQWMAWDVQSAYIILSCSMKIRALVCRRFLK